MQVRRCVYMAAVLALCGIAAQAVGQTRTTTGYYQSTLKWGSSTTSQTTQHNAENPQDAYEACIAAGRARANTATASIVWTCSAVQWFGRTTVSATPTCAAAPPPQEQVGTCPSGQTGGWPQTRAYVSAPYPTCWQVGSTWNPATPPAGACITPVKELPAPPSITAAQAGSDQTRIRVDWSAVAGAAAYSVERCIGSTCTNFTVIQCVTTNAFIHGPLTPPVTARYRIRASRATGCSATTAGNLGAYSALATGELTLASNGRVLTWIAPTTNTDGSALTNLAG